MILNSQQGCSNGTTNLELFMHYFPISVELTMQAYRWLLCRANNNAMPVQKKQITETRQGEVAVKGDTKGTSFTSWMQRAHWQR